mmetsp:Transcript_27237/g.68759  ORF Transcript_27237/g.68759 Transcript_27237/m.68759 type:complete len:234 (+) Transcript_27237:71-772(+)
MANNMSKLIIACYATKLSSSRSFRLHSRRASSLDLVGRLAKSSDSTCTATCPLACASTRVAGGPEPPRPERVDCGESARARAGEWGSSRPSEASCCVSTGSCMLLKRSNASRVVLPCNAQKAPGLVGAHKSDVIGSAFKGAFMEAFKERCSSKRRRGRSQLRWYRHTEPSSLPAKNISRACGQKDSAVTCAPPPVNAARSAATADPTVFGMAAKVTVFSMAARAPSAACALGK